MIRNLHKAISCASHGENPDELTEHSKKASSLEASWLLRYRLAYDGCCIIFFEDFEEYVATPPLPGTLSASVR